MPYYSPRFKDKVYQVVKQIPRGRVLSYKQVANLAGRPSAWRAVGNILKKNQSLEKIPCYRVIKSDGKIGGYVKGTNKKISLLQGEGLAIKNRRIVL